MDTTNAPLHVIFGTGPVGQAVMQELVAQGKRVRMVNRSGKANIPTGVELLAGDASDAHVAAELAKDAKVFYSCAYAVKQSSKEFLWEIFYHYLSTSIVMQGKRRVIPVSRHEPLYESEVANLLTKNNTKYTDHKHGIPTKTVQDIIKRSVG